MPTEGAPAALERWKGLNRALNAAKVPAEGAPAALERCNGLKQA